MSNNQEKKIDRESLVTYHADTLAKPCGPGVTRRILAYNAKMMAVELTFEQGAVGNMHHHPHTQCTYVIQGKFQYQIEHDTVELLPGDSIVIPSEKKHGTLCLETGFILDVFTPAREDILLV